jgi:hypothetical protein
MDFKTDYLYIKQLKGSRLSTHPITDDKMKALKQLQKENNESPYLIQFRAWQGNQTLMLM